MKKRNYGIDLIKILACMGVVFLHVSAQSFKFSSPFNVNIYIYYLGTLSIPLFFMVNGYFLLNKNILTYSYLLNKVYSMLVIITIWSFIYWLLSGNFYHDNLIKKVLGSLVQKGYFFQFWFFGSLIIIYLTLPILKRVISSFKVHIILLLILIVAGSLIQLINFFVPHPPVQLKIIQTFRIWTWYAYYILGAFLGRNEIKDKLKSLNFKFLAYLTLPMLLIMPIPLFYISHNIFHVFYAEYFYDSIFIKTLATSVFILCSNLQIKDAWIGYIKILSKNIMGIFILHYHVMMILGKFYNISKTISNLIAIVVVFVLSFSISYIISKITYINKLIEI